MMKHIEVVAAIIRKDGKIFATQRGYGDFKDWWEFPGGKMEPGETRELPEDLALNCLLELLKIDKLLRTVEWDYPAFHLTLHCFMCRLASEEMHLNEHEAAKWVDGESIYSLKWLPADEDVLPLIAEELRQES